MFDDGNMDTHLGLPRYVRRVEIYDDVMAMYKDNFAEIKKGISFSYQIHR